MAKQTKILCDRCDKEIEYVGWTAKVFKKKPLKVRIKKLYYGNRSGYDYLASEYELCKECTKKLESFLKMEE